MKRFRSLLAAVFCLCGSAAYAQWQWIDKDGRTVFSDRAPPPEIAQKSILRQPGNAARVAGASQAPAGPASAASAASADAQAELPVPKLGTVDKDLQERKKQAQASAAAKEKADAERNAKAKADNCERARASKALMESGIRVSVSKPSGEREIMDDSARAAETKRAQLVIDANCS